MHEVNEVFDIALPVENIYAAICDVGFVGYAVAGIKSVEVLGEDTSRWKVEVKAGIISRTLTLDGCITKREPPSLIAFEANGPNVLMSGDFRLSPLDAATTRCTVSARGEATGRLAPLINLVAKTTQAQLIAKTIANFRDKLAERAAAGR